ncbi:hypothetical protein G5S37_02445 [Roseimicrobium sp. ORNL1]|nr:hypothetical protein G5S37_02445 [Roseimicrobium sp. ORNL1]
MGVYTTTCPVPAEQMEVFNAHIHQHPLIELIMRRPGEPMRAARWSDYTTLRRFKQTGLYHDYFRKLGMRRQLAATLDVNGENTIALAFSRSGSDFRPDDASLLELFLPHVQCMIQNMIDREVVLALCDVAMNNEAVMLVDDSGALVYATEHARRLAREHFSVHTADGLPVEIRSWLQGSPALGLVRIWDLPGCRLSCTCSGLVRIEGALDEICQGMRSSTHVRRLSFVESRMEQTVKVLQVLGLTLREAEVLHWMAEGKRNGEIAIILGMKERTVDKHREHLFAKLGVETRTAAVAAARNAAVLQN